MMPKPSHSQVRCRCGTLVAIIPPEWVVTRWLDRHERIEDGCVGLWCPNLGCRAKLEIGNAQDMERAA